MEDGFHPAFDPNELRQHARSFSDTATAAVSVLVSHPDLRYEARRMELCQGYGVDLVSFNARVGDSANEPGIRDDDTLDVRSHESLYGGAVPSHLNHDLILEAEGLGEGNKRFMSKIHAKLFDDRATLKNRHLRERSMNIHSDDLHVVHSNCGSQWLARHLRIRARSAAGQVVGAAK